MARFVGVLACAIALTLPPLSGGVRSAPSLSTNMNMGKRAPREAAPAMKMAASGWRAFISARARSNPRPRHASPFTADRKVVLTFDDGPDLATTPLVLDTLDKYGYKAAFFVAGRRLLGSSPEARARRALLQEIVARGHIVANHTVRHKNLCREPELIDDEIDGNQRILTQVLGEAPTLFRPPFGAHCPQLERAVAERKLVSVGWTIDPQDWRQRNPDDVASYVYARLNSMDAHAVVLMHDTRAIGVHALPLILQWLEAQQARASRGEVRPIAVVSPTVLLASRELEPSGLEPLVQHWRGNLALLPGLAAGDHPAASQR